MSYGIDTELHPALIIVCFAVAFLYAYFLYKKDKKIDEVALWIRRIMWILRFIFVFILSILILAPVVKSIFEFVEKPIIIIAHDNSESICINNDSAYYRNAYKNDFLNFIEKLKTNYEVVTYDFGEKLSSPISFTFNDKESNYSKMLSEIVANYATRNIGALIIAGDGIYNKGINPQYTATDFRKPIYCIALGDTAKNKDIILSQVNYNKIVYYKNNFPINVFVEIFDLEGTTTRLNVYNKTNIVFSEDIFCNSKRFFKSYSILIPATETGTQQYKIEVVPVNQELNKKNNYKNIVIEVIDQRQKILLLANSPHPDIGAIYNALKTSITFEVEKYNISEFTKKIDEYNLVILHQLPSLNNAATEIINNAQKNQIPLLFILGSASDINKFNSFDIDATVKQSKFSFDEAQPEINKQFAAFEIPADLQLLSPKLAPLMVPFGDYVITGKSDILCYQKIKNISTTKPLIFFNSSSDTKIGVIAGEGIWRWRLQCYKNFANHDAFNELISKCIQFIALKLNKERFVVNANSIYNENEPIVITAELYNEMYELINDPEVTLDIFDAENKNYSFKFNRTNKAYQINAGIFSSGNYSFKAYTTTAKDYFTKSGKFIIMPVDIEAQSTQANHQLLYKLASQSNGKLFYPNQLNDMFDELKNNNDITSISFPEKKIMQIIHLKWIFFLLLTIITLEWFLRKYWGNY